MRPESVGIATMNLREEPAGKRVRTLPPSPRNVQWVGIACPWGRSPIPS